MARHGTRAAFAACVLMAVVAISACGGDGGGGEAAAPEEDQAEPDSSAQSPTSQLVEELGTEEKVAQLVLAGFDGTRTDDPIFSALEDPGYGGLVVNARNYVSAGQVGALADEAAAAAEEGDRLPPWVMAPQEGGEFNAFADLPPEEAPAEVRSPSEAATLAEETADALVDLGVNGILAPVLDVGLPSGGAVGRRAYSDTADRVTDYGEATLKAFEEARIFSAPKHFPGLGAASQSTEQGPANVGLTLDQLAERDLLPFDAAIEAGVPGIVVGHGLYGVEDFVTPASMSDAIVGDLLRDELGFDGVAIADDLTAPAITASFRTPAAAVDAIRAGVDMVYVSTGGEAQGAVYDSLLSAVREGSVTRSRLDQAVTRIVAAKRRFGLLDEALEQLREEREEERRERKDGGAEREQSEDQGGAEEEPRSREPDAGGAGASRARARETESEGERSGEGTPASGGRS